MLGSAFCDSVSDKSTKNLRPAVEAKPDSRTCALFGLGVPGERVG